ncbi:MULTISPECIES: portal protein [unclassified Bradyrhizobium]
MPVPLLAPAPLAPMGSLVTHDVTIVTTRKLAQARVMGVPPEEFGIERGARSIRDCNYCFHEIVTKTEAQLIAEGFDAGQVRALRPHTGTTEIETQARDTVEEHLSATAGGGSANSAARLVRITEHYVRMDYEGSGRPCLYQVITGGDQAEILRKDGKDCITPFDEMPFAATTPVPVTHRFFGRSIADLVMPLQREKTALKRGALDNLYLHNNPRVEVAEQNAGPNTLDDLLVSRPGGVVRTKTAGGLNWQVVPDITTSIYPMLQYLDAELEIRTGLGKQTQGIDANALQNQSATAVAQVFSASQMRIKLIARIMAEGVRDIFALLHGTIRKHGQREETVRLRNAWVDVNPRNWKTRDDMTINVGLGAGGKAQQFAQTMAIANVQKELLAGGKINLVGDRQLYNTAAELTRIMGHRNPDQFFNDPMAVNPQTGQLLHPPPAPPQPPPDPKLLALQARLQADQLAAAHKAQIEREKAQADAIHQQVKMQAEIEIARIRAGLDAKIAVLDAHLKTLGHEQKLQHAQEQHRMDVAEAALDIAASAAHHEMKARPNNGEGSNA